MRLGHNCVGTEHILLALFAAPETGAARILDGLGVDRDGVEAHILATLTEIQG
ncbi:MAG: Clp protease N-terminal domain-containing protein [Gordonia sp. (in: high G+C Gram-positive bacteria)]